MMQFTVQVAVSAITALLTAGTAAYLLRRDRSTETLSLVGFNVAVTIWTGGNALQVASTTLSAKLVWVNVQYVGIALLPISIFVFAVHLSGSESKLSRRRLGLLAAPLALLVLLSWTNAYHGLVRPTVGLSVVDGVATLDRTFGPAFWLGWAYSNLLNIVATVLVLRAVAYADQILERRVLALLIGPLVPWLAQFLALTGQLSVEPEVFFSVTGVAFAYALVTWDSVDPVIARDAVLELLDEGVVVVSDDGRVLDLNRAARDLLALGDAPAVGEDIADVLDAHPELLAAYHETEPVEDLPVTTGTTRRHLDVQFSSFEATMGNAARVMVLLDVTGLREQERVLARQNERLDSFASIVSHDLRNPLNVAEGRLELAQAEVDNEHLPMVAGAHERMEELIDDMLMLAREGESVENPETVRLAEVAEFAWTHVETAGATLRVEGDSQLRADSTRLQQLMENLYRNAIEHNDDSVTVTVGRMDDGFYVADDGEGISERERERLFDPGFTTRQGGTGLGLTIAEDIADAHGWQISVDASADGGTRFEILGVEMTAPESPRAT